MKGWVFLLSDGFITKPADMVARDREWSSLVSFATSGETKLRIGIVSGRRRHGKSFLLQHLAREFGGL